MELASADPALARARARTLLGSADAETRCVAGRALALAAKELGDLAAADVRLREAIALAEDEGLSLRAAQARLSLVAVLADQGRTGAALAEADAVRDSGLLHGVDLGRLLAQRAMALARDGRLHRALAAFDEAIPILRDGGDPRFVAGALSNRGLLQVHLGAPAAADADLSEAAVVAEGAGLSLLAAMARHNLGCAALRAGNLPRALSMFDAAEPAFAGSGERACCLAVDRAEALLAAGLTAAARDLLAGTVRRLGTFTADLADARLLLARARLATGEAAEAVRDARAARTAYRGRSGWALLATFTELEAHVAATGGPDHPRPPHHPAPSPGPGPEPPSSGEGKKKRPREGGTAQARAKAEGQVEVVADAGRGSEARVDGGEARVGGGDVRVGGGEVGAGGGDVQAGGGEARVGGGGGLGRRLLGRVRRCRRRLAQRGLMEAAARARILAGRLALAAGRIELARAELRAVADARTGGPVQLRVAAWHAEALLRLADGRPAAAAAAALAGLRVVTAYARTLGATELRAHAASEGRELAALGLRLAVESGRPRAVLAWLERGRAVAAETRPLRPPHDPAFAADLAELRRVSSEIAAAIATGGNPAPLRAAQLRLETTIRRRSHRTPPAGHPPPSSHPTLDPHPTNTPTPAAPATNAPFTDGVVTNGAAPDAPGTEGRRGGSVTAEAREGGAVTAEGRGGGVVRVPEVVAALGDRVLVEFGVLDGQLIAVVLDRGRCRQRPLGECAPVEQACATLRFALHRLAAGHGVPSARRALAYSAAELDRLLLAPLGLHDDRELVIVPAGPLHALPWGALPTLAGRPLTVAPSTATWLRATRTPADPPPEDAHLSPACHADPDNPGADRHMGRSGGHAGRAEGRSGRRAGEGRDREGRGGGGDRECRRGDPGVGGGGRRAGGGRDREGRGGGGGGSVRRPLLVAGPGTAYAEAEIAALHRLYRDATVLAGPHATASAVRAALDGAGPVHIAGHGEFRTGSPLLSGLMLADGPLFGYELESLRVPPPRVVLSACDAGRAEVPGDGIPLGVTGGLLRSGVRTVIAGITPVGDAATMRLMPALHERLIAGTPPAAALAATGRPESGFLCFGAS